MERTVVADHLQLEGGTLNIRGRTSERRYPGRPGVALIQELDRIDRTRQDLMDPSGDSW